MRRTFPMGVAVMVTLLLPVAVPAWQDVVAEASDDRHLGAQVAADGLAFGLYAPDATQVDLLLFDEPDATTPRQVVPLQRAGDSWRIGIRGTAARPGLLYLYRVAGPGDGLARRPLRRSVQLRTTASATLTPTGPRTSASRRSSPLRRSSTSRAPIYAGGGKSIVHDHAADPPASHVAIAPQDLILYELHVQDYTRLLDGLPAAERGTYLGLTRSRPHHPGRTQGRPRPSGRARRQCRRADAGDGVRRGDRQRPRDASITGAT